MNIRVVENKYIPGNHKIVCDECGMTYRRSEVVERWDGAWVCKKDYEPRHPQEQVFGRVDKIAVDVARPEGEQQLAMLDSLAMIDDLTMVG